MLPYRVRCTSSLEFHGWELKAKKRMDNRLFDNSASTEGNIMIRKNVMMEAKMKTCLLLR
jgi:hypothetical protein